MEVAFDRAHDDRTSRGGCSRLGQQRLENGHAGLHGPGGNQHLGNVETVVFEILSNDAHSGNEAFLEDVIDVEPLFEGLLSHLPDGICFTYIEQVVHQCVISHFPSPELFTKVSQSLKYIGGEKQIR